MTQPMILLSGFADEAAQEKTLDQQFSTCAALGMRYLSLRFLDAGNGIKNAMALTDAEVVFLKHKLSEYGLQISSLGSPIGKVKLLDLEDGTKSSYRPFDEYLAHEVPRACELTQQLGAKLVRGFSFYHPKGSSLKQHVTQATDQIGRIAEACQRAGLIFGLEVEANLVGQNGWVLADMHRAIANPALVLIFDGGNLVMQGYSTDEIFAQYLAMKAGLGWIHIKDFRAPSTLHLNLAGHVDEDAVKHFVPADQGDTGHEKILRDLVSFLPELNSRMTGLGADGVFVDLEPHLKGGGQFGGFSGPDGFGIALRAFCQMCDRVGIRYHLRDFNDIQSARDF